MCFFFNDTATTEIYTSFPTRRSSDLPPDDRRAGAGVRGGGRGGPGGRADRGPAAPGQLRGDGRPAGDLVRHGPPGDRRLRPGPARRGPGRARAAGGGEGPGGGRVGTEGCRW